MTQASFERTPSAARIPALEIGHTDWPAIFAGAVLASGLATLLLGFGTVVGLTIQPLEEGKIPGLGTVIAIGLWSIWAIVSSHMVGAYVTGRLRRRVADITEHEVGIRDGVHGLAVWAVGLLVGMALLASGIGIGARTGVEASKAAASILDTQGYSPQNYLADTLLRNEDARNDEATRAANREVVRIIQASIARGEISQDDRAYLDTIVARRTGIDRDKAHQRVEAVLNRLDTMKKQAKDKVAVVRKTTVLSAFVLTAALLIAAAGAWWAAGMGGRHRDERTEFPLFGRR